jgi:hypothetical protein
LTIEELEQDKYKKREISMIDEQIKELYSHTTSDVVLGSTHAAPYTLHTIAITGLDASEMHRANRRAKKLRARRYNLEADVNKAEDFIDGIDDSQIRQIIELKYIRGFSWNMVASRVYGYPNGDRARMKIERFFKNN